MKLWGVRLPPLARTTTFRLTTFYVVLTFLYTLALIGFIYSTTIGYARVENRKRIDSEIDSILLAYEDGGLSRVSQSLLERAAAPQRYFLYQLQTPSGIKLSGDLSAMPPGDYPGEVEFEIDVRRPGGSEFTIDVAGRVVNLGTEAQLLVGYDISNQGIMTNRITNAIYIAGGAGLLIAIMGGIWISRSVARRAQHLADTAEKVMGGDLTARARTRRTDDEFDRLAERLNAMLDRLQALVRSSRHTGDAIAHDLRSPLSRMRNRLENALSSPDPDLSVSDVIEQTIREVDGVLATFNAILRLSRLDAQSEMRMERTDLGEVVEELSDLFEPAAEYEGLEFRSESTRATQVLGDREMIAQALANLIDNAIKYTPEGGAISVSARRGDDNMVELMVKDTGFGIPETERERAKQRFVRMDSARTLPGSGLGLALVDAVAMVHRGEFQLLDGDGPPDRPGLKAVLRLPRA
ncbi:MAG: HAMP domain-containing histidine kinase [Hyphomonadaceae bacterium]|nr:HAMP domain-containing histidine kinase [Hyphomonadaceae bacterium]